VFGLHISALEHIEDFLTHHGVKAVSVRGGLTDKQKNDAVVSFMDDPACRVFIGNIKAAGVGLTLTSSYEIDMFESDWSPAGNAQAIMRVHRIGQTRNVLARFISLADTIDERVVRIVAEKTANIAAIENVKLIAAPDL